MSEKENKHNSELSMDELDAVAGGAAKIVNSSKSNIKNNYAVSTGSTPGTTPTVTGTAAADTSMTAATLTTTP